MNNPVLLKTTLKNYGKNRKCSNHTYCLRIHIQTGNKQNTARTAEILTQDLPNTKQK